MQFKKYLICFVFLLVAACTPKENSVENQVLISQSKPITLGSHKAENSSVYVAARRGESHIEGLQNAVEQAIRQKGYDIAQNPSSAGYIVHMVVPSIGTFNADHLQSIVKAGYGKAATPKSHSAHTEQKIAMVVDVLIVARDIPEKVNQRPDVVSTASKPSKVAEGSSRIMAAVHENDGDTFNEVRPILVQEIAKKIAASLPK